MSEAIEDNKIVQDAAQKFIADQQAQKAAEKEAKQMEEDLKYATTGDVRKLVDERMTKAEMAEIIAAQDKKIEDFKILMLRAKAQGKANIQEKNEGNNDEIRKIYGQNPLIDKIFKKN